MGRAWRWPQRGQWRVVESEKGPGESLSLTKEQVPSRRTDQILRFMPICTPANISSLVCGHGFTQPSLAQTLTSQVLLTEMELAVRLFSFSFVSVAEKIDSLFHKTLHQYRRDAVGGGMSLDSLLQMSPINYFSSHLKEKSEGKSSSSLKSKVVLLCKFYKWGWIKLKKFREWKPPKKVSRSTFLYFWCVLHSGILKFIQELPPSPRSWPSLPPPTDGVCLPLRELCHMSGSHFKVEQKTTNGFRLFRSGPSTFHPHFMGRPLCCNHV